MMVSAPPERPRRILCLTTRLGTGGAEMNAAMLARQFAELGCEVEMWALYRAGDMPDSAIPTRVFHDAPPANPLALASLILRFRTALREARPDRVYGFQPLANVLGGALHPEGTQFIGTQRNPAQSQQATLRVLERLIGATDRYAANIAVSQAVADSYATYGSAYLSKLRVVHNGLPPLAPIAETKEQARALLGLPQHVPIIGNIGRLHHQKDPEFLVRLMRHLPDVHLMLAGDGEMEAELRALARPYADRVHLVGRVAGEGVTRCYRALDLFVFPSRYEGFGRSLIEAMDQGVPVLANDIPVLREVAGDTCSFLPMDQDLWAQRIPAMLAGDRPDPAIARQRAAQFSLSGMVRSYLDVVPFNRSAAAVSG